MNAIKTIVTALRVGDRVRVRYIGGSTSEGIVFWVGKGTTSAKRADGSVFRIKHGAEIFLLGTQHEDQARA